MRASLAEPSAGRGAPSPAGEQKKKTKKKKKEEEEEGKGEKRMGVSDGRVTMHAWPSGRAAAAMAARRPPAVRRAELRKSVAVVCAQPFPALLQLGQLVTAGGGVNCLFEGCRWAGTVFAGLVYGLAPLPHIFMPFLFVFALEKSNLRCLATVHVHGTTWCFSTPAHVACGDKEYDANGKQ